MAKKPGVRAIQPTHLRSTAPKRIQVGADGKFGMAKEDSAPEFKTDGWQNLLTGLGTDADKRTQSFVSWESRALEDYEQAYTGDEIFSRIVNVVPEEALRRGWDLTGLENDQAKLARDIEQKLDVRGVIERTWKWARAYGGGCIYIVTEAQDPSKPLGKNEKVLALRDLSRYDLRVMSTDIESDFGSPNWGKPKIYYLVVQMGSEFKGFPIHHSRMIRFDGYLVPRRTYIRNNYWHDSILQRLFNVVRNYQTSNDSAASILQDFNMGVYKLKGLMNLVSSGKEDLVKKRIELANYSKSIIRALILDADEEDYVDLSRNVSGLADLLIHQGNRLVAATDIPHTKLLGESPDGSSATGNSTTTQWYDHVQSEQENYLRPRIKHLYSILFPDLETLDFKFKTLWQLDELEQADLRNKQAQTDSIYIEKGVVDPTEIAESRFGGDDYSVDTKLDLEARELGLMGAEEGAEEGDEPSPESPQAGTQGDPAGRSDDDPGAGGAAPYTPSERYSFRNTEIPAATQKQSAHVGISMSDPMFPLGSQSLPAPGSQKQRPRTFKEEAPYKGDAEDLKPQAISEKGE